MFEIIVNLWNQINDVFGWTNPFHYRLDNTLDLQTLEFHTVRKYRVKSCGALPSKRELKDGTTRELSFLSVVIAYSASYAWAALARRDPLWCLITSLFFLTLSSPFIVKHTMFVQQSNFIQYPETEYGFHTRYYPKEL